jgi:hypothetical protein
MSAVLLLLNVSPAPTQTPFADRAALGHNAACAATLTDSTGEFLSARDLTRFGIS